MSRQVVIRCDGCGRQEYGDYWTEVEDLAETKGWRYDGGPGVPTRPELCRACLTEESTPMSDPHEVLGNLNDLLADAERRGDSTMITLCHSIIHRINRTWEKQEAKV
jgi:hypothetical protein